MKKIFKLIVPIIPLFLLVGCGEDRRDNDDIMLALSDEFVDFLSRNIIFFFLLLILAAIGCFAGYKCRKFLTVFTGIIHGLILGLIISQKTDSKIFSLICAVALIALFFVYGQKPFLRFYSTFFNTALFLWIELRVAFVLFDSLIIYVLTILVPLFVGFKSGLEAITTPKPAIMISSSLSFGVMMAYILVIGRAAFSDERLSTVDEFKTKLIVASLFFVIVGFIVQYVSNHGFEEKIENQTVSASNSDNTTNTN